MTTDPRPGRGERAGLAACWGLAAGGTAAWGLVAVDRALPWQSVVALLLASGLVAASTSLSAEAVTSDRIDLVRAGRAAGVTALVVAVGVGLALSLGGVGVVWLGVLLLLRPGLRAGVRDALTRRRERRREQASSTRGEQSARPADEADDAWNRTVPGSLATDPGPASPPRRPPADAPWDTAPDWSPTLVVPTHLSDQDLCLAWESSGRTLQRCSSPGERLEAVRVRQACLDELERRRPDAVRAWMLAGADPDSSPTRYLGG